MDEDIEKKDETLAAENSGAAEAETLTENAQAEAAESNAEETVSEKNPAILNDAETAETFAEAEKIEEAADAAGESETTGETEAPAEDIETLKENARKAAAEQERARKAYEDAVKSAKKAQKEADKKASAETKKAKKGTSVGICILISAISVCVTLVIVFGVLFFWKLPIAKNSLIGNLISRYTGTSSSSGTSVGGNVIESGSNVTINVSGDTSNAQAVYAKAAQSVVGIRIVQLTSSETAWSSSYYQTVAEGSGVIYTSDGYIMTNHHVIEDFLSSGNNLTDGYKICVYLDSTLQTYYEASIVGYNAKTDLALLKIDATGLTPIEIADSDSLTVGETVYAIGSPAGLSFMNSLSDGIISGLNRSMTSDDVTYYGLIQTNAPLSYGNSGGALLNAEGQLIGINFMKIVASGYEGMSFAIPSNTIVDIIGQIQKTGTVSKPQLGITVATNYTATEAAQMNYPAGAWIYEIVSGSCCEKAGLKSNMIITAFAGVTVSTFSELKAELAKYNAGDTVVITAYDVDTGTSADYTVVLDEAN